MDLFEFFYSIIRQHKNVEWNLPIVLQLCFVAQNLPALGTRTFELDWVRPEDAPLAQVFVSSEEDTT